MNIKIPIGGRSLLIAINENSTYSNESYFNTPQTEIDKCLCCCYEFCDNCLGRKGNKHKDKEKKKGRPQKFDLGFLKEILSSGKSSKAICQELDISKVTLIKYKKLLKEEKINERTN